MGTVSRLTTTIAAGALLAASTLPSLAASPSINDIDALGLPELSAAEASEVRGESALAVAAAAMGLSLIAFLHYKWVTDPEWIMNNRAARTLWNEIRS